MSSDPLVSCILEVETAASPDIERDAALTAARAAAAPLFIAWEVSQSASALLAVGELASAKYDLVRAALECARLAQDASPSLDPNVLGGLDCVEAWLAGVATDEQRATIGSALAISYNGRADVPLAAWATYCACCVGSSEGTSAWYHASAAAECAKLALREGGRPEPEQIVAGAVRRHLSCPSIEQVVISIIDDNFSLP